MQVEMCVPLKQLRENSYENRYRHRNGRLLVWRRRRRRRLFVRVLLRAAAAGEVPRRGRRIRVTQGRMILWGKIARRGLRRGRSVRAARRRGGLRQCLSRLS